MATPRRAHRCRCRAFASSPSKASLLGPTHRCGWPTWVRRSSRSKSRVSATRPGRCRRRAAPRTRRAWRPGALERLDFGYAAMNAINPRLIYTSISGFGHRDLMPGPFTDWPAFDVIGQAMAGLMFRPERSGDRPVYLGFPLVDLFSAVTG